MDVKFTLRGVELSREQMEVLTRKAEFAFDRFSHKLASVEVILKDINGPRGGEDKVCQLILRLDHEPTMILEERGVTAVAVGLIAMERAARRLSEKKPRWQMQRIKTAT